MKALLLAAGYATRLYPLTLDQPKPLLRIAGRPVIDFILDMIEQLEDVDEVFVVTNDKFNKDFERWKDVYKGPKQIVIVNDGTTTPEARLGATGDIQFVIEKKDLKDDLLIIAGDNLFKADLGEFIEFSISKRPHITLGLYDVMDLKLARRYGVALIGKDNRVECFVEKSPEPVSTLAAMCLYFFPKESLGLLKKYLESGVAKDAPGHFLEWLYKKEPVFGFIFKDKKWFDIGDQDSYLQANKEYT